MEDQTVSTRAIDHAGLISAHPRTPRLESVDILRGLVMIIMALDHTRDMFGMTPHAPEDLSQASGLLFFTRWITHFCAPAFVFLAGTGAYLSLSRGRSKRELSRFLVTRGLWLVVAEVTLVNFGWGLYLYGNIVVLQVIWVIGISMIILAGLIRLPIWAMSAIGGCVVLGHNLLDGIGTEGFGDWGWVWSILHSPNVYTLMDGALMIAPFYTVIPWFGVMALGYGFGALFRKDPRRRRRMFWVIGGVAIIAFIVLRLINFYGDPTPWEVHDRGKLYTVLSFLNTTKYPPSLLFLLVTLGPAIISLILFEKWRGRLSSFIATFGRVPMFYYLLHVPLIHVLAIIWSFTIYQSGPGWWFGEVSAFPPGYTPNLALVYTVWFVVVLLLYPLCRRYARYKHTHSHRWLSYL